MNMERRICGRHTVREWYQGNITANGAMTLARANRLIADGIVSMVSFAKAFISNPDLVSRFEHGLPLNPGDPSTYYAGDEKGYTDYPSLENEALVTG